MTGIEIMIAIGAAAAIAGATTGIVGAVSSSNQAKAQSKLYDYNAKQAEQDARVQTEQADYEARRRRLQLVNTLDSQKAAAAASGQDIGYGSSLDILTSTTAEGTLDELAIKYGGKINSNSYLSKANNERYSAGIARTSANTILTQGLVNTGAQFAGNIAGLGMSGYQANQVSPGSFRAFGNNSLSPMPSIIK